MLIALAAVAPIAAWIGGVAALVAASVAWLACTIAGASGLGVTLIFVARGEPLGGLLWGLMLRMILPLLVCVCAYALGGALAESGIAFYLLAFYGVDLASGMMVSAWALRGVGVGQEDS
jgi:hypothetical protein